MGDGKMFGFDWPIIFLLAICLGFIALIGWASRAV
jgi:hypothetical protein